MRTEVACACEFICRMLISRHVPIQFIKPFSHKLEEVLTERFKEHWHPENPRKGSAYRCIRINGKMDPVVKDAAKVTGLSNIGRFLPREFTMWIDPNDVSYRFGEDGSICQCPLVPTTNGSSEFPFSESVWQVSHTKGIHSSYFDVFHKPAEAYENPISVQV